MRVFLGHRKSFICYNFISFFINFTKQIFLKVEIMQFIKLLSLSLLSFVLAIASSSLEVEGGISVQSSYFRSGRSRRTTRRLKKAVKSKDEEKVASASTKAPKKRNKIRKMKTSKAEENGRSTKSPTDTRPKNKKGKRTLKKSQRSSKRPSASSSNKNSPKINRHLKSSKRPKGQKKSTGKKNKIMV